MSHYFPTAVLTMILCVSTIPCHAQQAEGETQATTIDLSDFDAAPDGVSILSLEDDSFKMLSIATAPYRESTPAALSKVRTVAITKAKGALSRFLNESVSAEDFVEKEVSKVKTVSPDGTVSVAQSTARRTLSRIKTQSQSLLRGVVILQTERIPDEDGPGGSFRVMVGVSSTTLQGAETLDTGIKKTSN